VTTSRHPAYDLRRRYHARVRNAGAAAIVLHGIVFAVAPPYQPRPAGRPSTPLRLVAESGGWGAATGEAGASAAAASAAAGSRDEVAPARSLPAGASVVESRVTTESAASALPDAGAAATIRGGASVQGGVLHGGTSGIEEEGPEVFYNFDTPPRAIRRVEPDYPAAARSRDEEGMVVVNVNIDERGRILRAWVAAKDASETLVSTALDAAYQFQFLPGKQRGIPVKCTVAIPFRFHLMSVRQEHGGK
jgi:protein TonB